MKLTDKCVSFEMAILVLVELDSGFVAVCALRNHAELGKDIVELVNSDTVRERGDVDGIVARRLLGLLLLGVTVAWSLLSS